MDASLVMFRADGERRDFPLKRSAVVLGRKRSCQLRIPISSVSREHARVEERDDGLYLRDLGSSNGTFLNGDRIREKKLSPGDTITIGPVNLIVVIDGKPSQLKPVATALPGEKAAAAEESEASGLTEQPVGAAEEDEEDDALDLVGVEDEGEEPPARKKRPEAPVASSEGDDEDEDPISSLEAMTTGDEDEEDEDESTDDAESTFDAIFGSEDDDTVPFLEDENEKNP